MASEVRFLTNLDVSANEIRNVKAQILGAEPQGAEGRFYYDSTSKTFKYHDGTSWVSCAAFVGYGAVNGTAAFGQSAANGSASTVSRSDHVHAMPAHDAAAHSAVPLSALAVPTADVAFNSRKITGLANGTAQADAVNKSQLDAAVDTARAGLDVKNSVRVATATQGLTGSPNHNNTGGASGRGQYTNMPNSVSGVTLVNGDRVLITNTASSGIYTVTTAGTGSNGVWDRATDFDSNEDATPNAFTFVEEGTYADTGWVLTTNGPITLGGAIGTVLSWSQFTGAGSFTAGAGLTQSGSTIAVGAGTGISVTADAVAIDTAVVPRKYAVDIGGAGTSYTITHNLNTRDVCVSVRATAGSYEGIHIGWEATTVNTITVYFATAPLTEAWRVVVIG